MNPTSITSTPVPRGEPGDNAHQALLASLTALGEVKKELLIENQALLNENQTLRETLSFTQRVAEELLSQNNAYYNLLGRKRSNLLCSNKKLNPQSAEPIVQIFTGGAFIGGIWLASPNNAELLGEAEAQWENGEPQRALNTLTTLVQTLDQQRFASRIKVNLLSAAILQNRGVPQRALDVATHCLRDATTHCYWDLMGICNFIRGRSLIDLGLYKLANQALAFAVHTPGYADKVKEYRDTLGETVNEVEEEPTITRSTNFPSNPIISRIPGFVSESLTEF